MANKSLLITGGVTLILSTSLILVAGLFANDGANELREMDNLEYNIHDYYYGSFHQGNESVANAFPYLDKDGLGSLPQIIMLHGNYSDANRDGIIDVCEDLKMVIHEGQNGPLLNGSDDVINVTDLNVGTLFCTVEKNLELEDVDALDGMVQIGHVCNTVDLDHNCEVGKSYLVQVYDKNGTLVPFTIFDSDGSLAGFLQEVIPKGASGAASLSVAGIAGVLSCCGILAGVLIIITGLIISSPIPKESVFVYDPPEPISESFEPQDGGPAEVQSKAIGEEGDWWDGIGKKY